MAIVTHLGVDYPCSTALRGSDYVHLLNAKGEMTTAFDGVSDFSDFSITGGSWTYPTADAYCYLAVVRDDGTIAKGSHRCSSIPTYYETWTFTLEDGSTTTKQVVIR